ncbi:MAG: N-acetyl-gamma-glutamyl-phosphate reductase [Leptospirales bacterium]
MAEQLRVGVVGASGYAGGELIRLLLAHPLVRIVHLAADSRAGEPLSSVFPNFPEWGKLERFDLDAPWQDVDVVFTALPAGQSSKIAKCYWQKPVRIIDLGPDFRFRSEHTFLKHYKIQHPFPEGLSGSAYALVEWNRDAIRDAQIISCPGCYPTGSLLGILPFAKAGFLGCGQIFVDGKSGVTGSGRGLTLDTHFPEIAEGMKPYNPFSHRHTPEMEEALSMLTDGSFSIFFVPHLIPINRGLLSTIYLMPEPSLSSKDAMDILKEFYEKEAGILLVDSPPNTNAVRGTNRAAIAVAAHNGALVVMTAIDNLLKGAAGQSIQAMNVAFGFEEQQGLPTIAGFP